MARPPRRTSGPSTPSAPTGGFRAGTRAPRERDDTRPAEDAPRGRTVRGVTPQGTARGVTPHGTARGVTPHGAPRGAPRGAARGAAAQDRAAPARAGDRAPRDDFQPAPRGDSSRAPRDDFSRAPQNDFSRAPREEAEAPRPPRPTTRAGDRFANRAPDRPPTEMRGPRFTPRAEDRPAREAPLRGRAARERQEESPRAERAPRGEKPVADAMAAPSGSLWLYGQHAVAAALANPARRVRRLLLTADAEETLTARLPGPWRVQAERVEKSRFQTFLTEDAVHQGAALLADPLQPMELEDALARSNGPVLLLDQVTDPRNVGAILRSAAAFGAAAVVLQDRHAPPETAALARTASGALEIVPVVRAVNLSRAIVTLQKAGFWVMGLDGSATRELAEARPADRRVALVLGSEDAGLRRLQRETCDELVRLPIVPEVESLNVAAAATAALYELVRKPG